MVFAIGGGERGRFNEVVKPHCNTVDLISLAELKGLKSKSSFF